MAEKDIFRKMLTRSGQSQPQRTPAELDTHYADIDERTTHATLKTLDDFAAFVRFYEQQVGSASGDWKGFFPAGEAETESLLNTPDGQTPPHQALFLAFRKMYEEGPKRLINQITGRHLDFYYKDILRLTKKPAQPDHAHVVLELKKNSSPILVKPKHELTAGKDASGKELIYKPVLETIINSSKVEKIQSLYYNKEGAGGIHYASVANSADGIGGKIQNAALGWYGFGHRNLPPAETGFAFGSPVLLMKEGTRKVIISLSLNTADEAILSEAALKGLFEAYITGEKSWAGPYTVAATWNKSDTLQLEFTIPSQEKSIIGYSPAIHGYRYSTSFPVVQILLKPNTGKQAVGYNELKELDLLKAEISVEVSGAIANGIENDLGKLDPKKAFSPFGQQPAKGAKFHVDFPEALSKNLTELSLSLSWKNPPANFSTHYQAYGISVSNDSFTSSVSFGYGENKQYSESSVELFDSTNATRTRTLVFSPANPGGSAAASHGKQMMAFKMAGTVWSKYLQFELIAKKPYLQLFPLFLTNTPEGRISFTLNKGFYHSEYLRKSVENVVNFVTGAGDPPDPYVALNEPYTPVIQQMQLSYKATTGPVAVSSPTAEDFADDQLQFFQLAYSGQMREHAFQRKQFSFLSSSAVSLFYNYVNEGEMMIGLSGLMAGESVSILFQVAEGSEDPDLPAGELSWSILTDNYWKPMRQSEVVLDTTRGLLSSGIIQFVIPTDATSQNTLLEPGLIWIKAGLTKNVMASCRIIDIHSNAVEVVFSDQGNDPSHLSSALPAGSIAKFRLGEASVKTILQPYASFGGSREEADPAFYTRVSERLRHKNRSITSWDYERIILEAFPEIHKVKCIPHSRYFEESKKYCWLAPGYVIIVTVPDLRNKNAVNPLQPRVNRDTLNRIEALLNNKSGMQVKVKVKNPRYQQVRVECKVKLRVGYEFNFYSEFIGQRLIEFLSPWAFGGTKEISFGGKLYKSVLLNFVEELDCVDYIEDFFLYSISDQSGLSSDTSQVEPETPDTILVSAPYHIIHEVK